MGLKFGVEGLRVAGCGLRVAGCELRVGGWRLRVSSLRVSGMAAQLAARPCEWSYTSFTRTIHFHFIQRNYSICEDRKNIPSYKDCVTLFQCTCISALFRVREVVSCTCSSYDPTLLPSVGCPYPVFVPVPGLISQNMFINEFQKVNSPTKSSTCCLLLLIKTFS